MVRLAVRGLANKQIARQLRISPRTVEGPPEPRIREGRRRVQDRAGSLSRSATDCSPPARLTEPIQPGVQDHGHERTPHGAVTAAPSTRGARAPWSSDFGSSTGAILGTIAELLPSSSVTSPWTNSWFWLLQLVILAVSLVRLAVVVHLGLERHDPGGRVLDAADLLAAHHLGRARLRTAGCSRQLRLGRRPLRPCADRGDRTASTRRRGRRAPATGRPCQPPG